MSKFDKVRVKFVVTEAMLSDAKMRSLIKRVFGKDTVPDAGDCRIKCPASMFAIFVVERNRLKMTNLIQQLEPELLIPEEVATELETIPPMDFDIQ